jgi:hypothetical protein
LSEIGSEIFLIKKKKKKKEIGKMKEKAVGLMVLDELSGGSGLTSGSGWVVVG